MIKKIFFVVSILFILSTFYYFKDYVRDKPIEYNLKDLNEENLYCIKDPYIVFNNDLKLEEKVDRLKKLKSFLQDNTNLKCTLFNSLTSKINKAQKAEGIQFISNDQKIINVDKNYSKICKINLKSGRNFEDSDFDKTNKTIPVLCSENLSNIYQVGDTVPIDEESEYEVVGVFYDDSIVINKTIGFTEEVNFETPKSDCFIVPRNSIYTIQENKSEGGFFEGIVDSITEDYDSKAIRDSNTESNGVYFEIKNMIIESNNIEETKELLYMKLDSLDISRFNICSFKDIVDNYYSTRNAYYNNNGIIGYIYKSINSFLIFYIILIVVYFYRKNKTTELKNEPQKCLENSKSNPSLKEELMRNEFSLKEFEKLVKVFTVIYCIHFLLIAFSIYPEKRYSFFASNYTFDYKIDLCKTNSSNYRANKNDIHLNAIATIENNKKSFKIESVKTSDGKIIEFQNNKFYVPKQYGNVYNFTDQEGNSWTVYMKDFSISHPKKLGVIK